MIHDNYLTNANWPRIGRSATRSPTIVLKPMTNPECIFCKSTTGHFTSIEHIVPESLGNTEHVLPPGVVCDSCNNYFARKVEQPILGSDYFSHARHRNRIRSKKGRIPAIKALTYPQGIPIDLGIDRDEARYLAPQYVHDNSWFQHVLSERKAFCTVFPVALPPDARLFSRFLLAIGIKAVACRMLSVPRGIHVELTHNRCFDPARRFARYGDGPVNWPFHETVLYDENKLFTDSDGVPYQISHEYTLLWTESSELYFVTAILGVQYAINFGGPDLAGFITWLADHDNQSPLYSPGIN